MVCGVIHSFFFCHAMQHVGLSSLTEVEPAAPAFEVQQVLITGPQSPYQALILKSFSQVIYSYLSLPIKGFLSVHF